MAKNYYANYTFAELAEVYRASVVNGKLDVALLEEIDNRGGVSAFKEQIALETAKRKERQRIIGEVAALAVNAEADFIKKLISSDLLGRDEVDALIDSACRVSQKSQINRSITATTVIGSIIGLLAGSIIGIAMLYFEAWYLGRIYYSSLVVIYGICYLIIRLITKQNAGNVVVFLSALAGTIISAGIFIKFFL